MKVIVIFTIIFLWNIQTSLAQTASAGSMKIYITWIRIKAEKEKKNRSNFDISGSAIQLPCKYKKTNYLSGRYALSNAEAGNISLVQVRNHYGAGKDVPADDFMVDLYVGKSTDYAGFIYQDPNSGEVRDLEASVINGLAAVAGSVLLAALGGTTGGNSEINLPKAHVHRKEPLSAKNNEKLNSLPLNGLQLNENPRGFSFTQLRDTLADIDGNVYHIAALGAMVIMSEDLRVTHFHNGKKIAFIKDSTDLVAADVPAYCINRIDSGNTTANGMLYNWHAVIDTSRICPKNWHIPSSSEWTSLITCLGGTNKAAGKLKENFSVAEKVCRWWASGGHDTGHAQCLYMDLTAMEVKLMVTDRNSGLPVRCIRDY